MANRSALVIIRTSSEAELAALLESYDLTHELLVITQFGQPSTLQSLNTKITIFDFDHTHTSGVISKLAFSYAKSREFEVVAGIFDWGSLSFAEIDKLVSGFASNGALLIPLKVPAKRSIITKLVGLFSNVPGAFLNSFRCQGAFSGNALKIIPLEQNLSVNSFDTELVLQFLAGNLVMDESTQLQASGSSLGNNLKDYYLAKLLMTQRLQKLGIFYDPRFDLIQANNQYEAKFDFESSHSMSLSRIKTDDNLLILGSGPKELVAPFAQSAKSVVAVDSYVDSELRRCCNAALQADIETIESYDQISQGTISQGTQYSKVIALDIIEHLRSPEEFLHKIRSSSSTAGSRILITTPNIAFLPIRLMLLFGFFNYGKRGILDRTHTRLFTISSLRRLLRQSGYEVEEIIGVPAPIPLALGRGALANFLLELNSLCIKIWPSLFSFQILAQARALPTVEQLLNETRLEEKAVG